MTKIAHRHASPAHSSPGAPPGASTVGAQLRASPGVHAAVRAVVAEIQAASARITDVRPPDPALREGYESLMKRAAEVRGRALLYPYIGSGSATGHWSNSPTAA